MKILYYSAHSGGFIYEWHFYHTISELRDAGHEVIYLNPAEVLGRAGGPDEYSQVLLDKVKEFMGGGGGLDLLFASATDETVNPSAIKTISRMGIPTVNLSCDDLSHPFRIKNISSSFDLTWSTVRENAHILRSYGANLIIQPWAANPNVFKPVQTEEELAVGFIGSCYGARGRNLAVMASAGLPVKVYGKSPDDVYSSNSINHPLVRAIKDKESWVRVYESLLFKTGRKCLWGSIRRSILETVSAVPEKTIHADAIEYFPGPQFEELGERLSQIAISLGSIDLSSTYVLKEPLLFIRLREFEVPMCGGIHLVNRFPELQEYFEEDKEMLFYGDLEEMVDKARFYLSPERANLRQIIRKNARERAVRDHTWIHRFRKLGQEIGLVF